MYSANTDFSPAPKQARSEYGASQKMVGWTKVIRPPLAAAACAADMPGLAYVHATSQRLQSGASLSLKKCVPFFTLGSESIGRETE